jgi:signal transduction histidine kinase
MKPKSGPFDENPGARSGMWAAFRPQAGPYWLVLFCGLARQAAQATEADRGRAALLVAVSHDLRGPLAAAKVAVSGLRSRDARFLTPDDRNELLAAAEESLGPAHPARGEPAGREPTAGRRAGGTPPADRSGRDRHRSARPAAEVGGARLIRAA